MPKSPELPQVRVTIIVHDDGTQDRVRTNAAGTSSIESYDGIGRKNTLLSKILRLAMGKDGDEIWKPVGSVDHGSHAEVVGERMLHTNEQLAQVRYPANPTGEWRGKTADDFLG